MNFIDLTSNQLKRALGIKQRIEALNAELNGILGGPATSVTAAKKRRCKRALGKRIVALKPGPTAAKAKKKVFSRATRAKLSAKLKAYWAAKRAGKR